MLGSLPCGGASKWVCRHLRMFDASPITARIGAIAAEEGFALNFRKTGVMTTSTRQRVTGLVINNKLAVPRSEVERLRAITHNDVLVLDVRVLLELHVVLDGVDRRIHDPAV